MYNKKKEDCHKDPDVPSLFRYLSKLMEKNFNSQLEQVGLTSQQGRAIFFICHQGQVRQSEIQEHLKLNKSTTSGLVKRMLNNELIAKSDRSHGHYIVLTEKGRNTIDCFHRVRDNCREQLLNGFTSEEQEKIKEILKRMIDNIEEGNK